MIRYHVLGGVAFQAADGSEMRAAVTGAKRLAVLSYLAVQRPHGFHRRDTLLGLFWPEHNQERGRNALRQMLHALRQDLGPGVLVGRGEEEVGLDTEAFWCDASAFDDALDAGRLADALELYRGDLLPGFFLTKSPGFERWLEDERARLRERASGAAWTMAEASETHGEASAAGFWARRAVLRSPDDERAYRRLIELLTRLGDRPGALRAYEDLTRRLAETYDLEPSAETRALIESVRTTSQGATTAGNPARPDPPTGPVRSEAAGPSPGGSEGPPAAPGSPDVTSGSHDVAGAEPKRSGGTHRRRWTSRRRWLVSSGLVAAGAVAAWLFGIRGSPSAEVSSAAVIAVLPFQVRGDTGFEYLREGIAQLLSTDLDGAGGLRAADPRALLTFVAHDGQSTFDPERGGAVASRFGADLYVLGDAVAAGGRLRLEATLYDRRVGARPRVQVSVQGPASTMLDLVDRLAEKLIGGLSGKRFGPLSRAAALTTPSLPALKAYLQGESAMRHEDMADAVAALRNAVEDDSLFALAYYRLSIAADWTDQGVLARKAAEEAVRHEDRLDDHDRRLIYAWRAFLQGRANEAEGSYRGVLALYPADAEAWYRLGEVLFHDNAMRGRPVDEARNAFERVLRYDPTNSAALVHLARMAAANRDLPELDSITARILTSSPTGDRALEVRALRAFTVGDRAREQDVIREAHDASGYVIDLVGRDIAVFDLDLTDAITFEEMLTEPTRALYDQRLGHLVMADLQFARGRRDAARGEFAAADSTGLSAQVLAARALWSSLPFLQVPRARLRDTRRAVLRWDPSVEPMPSARPHLGPLVRSYLLGLVDVRLGDIVAAERRIAELEAGGEGQPAEGVPDSSGRESRAVSDSTGDVPALADNLAQGVQASVDWSKGDLSGALSALKHVNPVLDMSLIGQVPFAPPAYERYLRAEVLQRLGRYREALRWYGSFQDPSGYDVIFRSPAELRQAQIYEKLGDGRKAADHYRRFVALWKDCDPALRPSVREAEARLKRSGAGVVNR